MTRLQFIAAVLRLAAPHWQPVDATAAELVRLERRHHIDAVLVIALARHETQWRERAINPSSGTVGLLQIQPQNFRACRDDDESPACVTVQDRLLSWRENLRIGVSYYASARRYCLRRGRGGAPEAWLQLPTGFDAVRHSRCGWRDGRRLTVPPMVVAILRDAASLRHAPLSRRVLAPTSARRRSTARVRTTE